MGVSTWHIKFTGAFRNDVKKLDRSGFRGWLSNLNFLKIDPYASNNQLKPFKGMANGFRWRKGDLRVIFRVLADSHSVLLLRAGHRKDVYQKSLNPADISVGNIDTLESYDYQQTSPDDLEIFDDELSAEQISLDENSDAVVEEIFISEDELVLLGIPEEYHSLLTSVDSLENALANDVPGDIVDRLEDYYTAPGQHHVGRIYALEATSSLDAISDQSIGHFLVALDPQQREVVDKSFDKGPLLIRGGPGTGKTLVNIARMKRVYHERVSESLFDEGAPLVGFVTFNKALSRTGNNMLNMLLETQEGVEFKFMTLDSVVYRLLDQIPKSNSKICKRNQDIEALQEAYGGIDRTIFDDKYLVSFNNRRSKQFVVEEFEDVIFGNDLLDEERYGSFKRSGRKTPLQPKERKLIFALFKEWVKVLKARNLTTFSARRLRALRGLEAGEINAPKYNLLFVDELQDIPVCGLRILTYLVDDVRHLTLTADTAQSIYLKSPSWSDVAPGLKFNRGNSFILRKSYRMTRQISDAIAPLRASSGESEGDDDGVSDPVFTGEAPHWIRRKRSEHTRASAEIAWELIAKRKINPGQIAVIVHDKRDAEDVVRYLTEADVPCSLVDKHNDLKLEAEQVHVMTAHTSKGLEFPFVIVPTVVSGKYPHERAVQNCLDDNSLVEEMDKSKRLLYVALSRAARELWMLSDLECSCPFLQQLDPKYWQVEEIAG